jgi:hypothetical protein
MDVARILGYEGSPNFLLAEEDFPQAQELGYALRQAKTACGLKGVYVLRAENDSASPIPVLYFCQANTEAEARSIHKRVWNQDIVPFVLVQTPMCLRLYSGFRYKHASPAETETDGILKPSIAFNEVTDQLAAFQASAIDDGTLWQDWGDTITLETRVDWTLLENLKNLDRYLQECGVSREVSHALIGKFVYFRYLRDRNILSNGKLAKWGIAPESVFSRHATLDSFLLLDQRTHDWLNGSIFPLKLDALSSIAPSLFQQVSGVFTGDTVDGQLHLDFQPYDFSFIPIETLSVIYEQFLHMPEAGQHSSRGREAGAYYTPIPLIAFMLEELERKHPLTTDTKILDPSCGSGAFLVQCYRRLIEKQLRQVAGPLQPGALRELLTTQIFGVDQDGDACRVAELSLILTLLDYITPPDLENNPTFMLPSLRNTNIFEANFFEPTSAWAEAAATKKFDWVIGNPPWFELNSTNIHVEDRSVWQWMQDNAREAPTGGHQKAEAFVWKSLPYLKQDGVAGLVLPAMTLFKKESAAFRQRFFASVRTWCMANFSNLAYVLFAGRAKRSALVLFFQPGDSSLEEEWDESILTYAPLVVNQEANRPSKPGKQKITWNITISSSEIQEVPVYKAMTGEILPWKLAMWGCFRDSKLLEKVARKFPTFRDFAETHEVVAHEGFQLREKSAQAREPLEAKPELVGKKRADFTKLKGCGRIFVFPASAIAPIPEGLTYIRKGRGEIPMRVSTPPHLLVDAGRRFAIYSDEFIAVPARQIGIAASSGKESLLKALSLYLSSDFVTYQQFFITPEWGISTSRATLDALRNLPVPLDNLSEKELNEWAELRDILEEISESTLESHLEANIVTRAEPALADKIAELNDKVYGILGLQEAEKILIQDFISVNMQCIQGKVTKEALARPSESTMQLYLERLQKELDAFIADQPETQHEIIAHYDTRSAMVAIRLPQAGASQTPTIRAADQETSQEFVKIRERLKQRHSQWMYFNRSLRIYDHDAIYCFKPMHALHWTQRQAILDAGEVITETLAAEEQ